MLPSDDDKRATRAAVALVAIGLLSRTAVLRYWTANTTTTIGTTTTDLDDGLEKKKVLTTTQHQNRKRKGRRKRRRRTTKKNSSTGIDDSDEEEKSANESDSDELSSAYSSAREDEEMLTREDGDGVGIVIMMKSRTIGVALDDERISGGNSDEENFETPVGTPRFVKRETIMDRIKEEWRKEGKREAVTLRVRCFADARLVGRLKSKRSGRIFSTNDRSKLFSRD